MGTVKHSHTTQPGQPPYYQSYSSSNTEKASTQPVQLPQTYTTVVYQCYTPVVVQKPLCNCYTHPLHSDLVVLSYKMSQALHAHQNCSFHTDRAATTHLLRPQQDWRQTGNITLNGIVANSSRALLVQTVTTLVDCWLVKIIVL